MRLAVPKEIREGETRVAATPESVKKLKGLGLDVVVQAGAGAGAKISDADYAAAGATIAPDAASTLGGADIVLKVRGPSAAEISQIKNGAVLAVTVYGIGEGDVLVFGVVANVVAALGALVAGRVDDRTGPKAVIVASLLGMIACATVLLFLSGPAAFWVFGLGLCLFVGPAQSSSRTYLCRLAPPGREGELFGLYATTGRAVSFLAPTLVGVFTYVFGSDRAGIVGIIVVLAAGLAALWPVRPPVDTTTVSSAGPVAPG